MPFGAGKYDEFATEVMKATEAEGAMVIVMNGNRGTGFAQQFSARSPMEAVVHLLKCSVVLREMADQIAADAERLARDESVASPRRD